MTTTKATTTAAKSCINWVIKCVEEAINWFTASFRGEHFKSNQSENQRQLGKAQQLS